ncbi:MAG: hypothetical protein HY296_04475 [Thaumarchaeota archaeon]|nr:hypothetical protein [Nitrososphaerota archaeon]
MVSKAISWLLEPENPPVRMFTLTDVLGKPEDSDEVKGAKDRILSYGPVQELKNAQGGMGYWPPGHTCYTPKFTSTVWQLQLLGELGVPKTPWIGSAVERFLDQHQMDNGAFSCPSTLEERRYRAKHPKAKRDAEPCLTGNMVRTLIVFGYLGDGRIRKAIEWFPEDQQEDGGWNCDYPMQKPTHSSFMSTIEPLWAYSEIPRSSWTRRMKSSVDRGAEFLLAHRLFKSHRNWSPVEFRDLSKVFSGNLVSKFHFPMYYYYDALHALRVLTLLGYGDDKRMGDAIHLMHSKRTPDGRWLLDGDWSRERNDGKRRALAPIENLNEPSKWVTLNCYRVLAKTGELELPR